MSFTSLGCCHPCFDTFTYYYAYCSFYECLITILRFLQIKLAYITVTVIFFQILGRLLVLHSLVYDINIFIDLCMCLVKDNIS